MTTILAMLAFGTPVFWLCSAIVFIIITALVENDEGFWATIVAIGTICSLQFLSNVPLFTAIKAHPGKTVLYILSYFAIGAAWSLFKWYIFLHKARAKYDELKAKTMEKMGATTFTGEVAVKLMDALAQENRYLSDGDPTRINSTPPLARKHKSSLTRWATYWPFSMVGFALNDIVRKLWNYIYDLLQSTYQRISNHVFRDVSADVALAQNFTAKKKADAEEAAATLTTTIEPNSPRRGNNRAY